MSGLPTPLLALTVTREVLSFVLVRSRSLAVPVALAPTATYPSPKYSSRGVRTGCPGGCDRPSSPTSLASPVVRPTSSDLRGNPTEPHRGRRTRLELLCDTTRLLPDRSPADRGSPKLVTFILLIRSRAGRSGPSSAYPPPRPDRDWTPDWYSFS